MGNSSDGTLLRMTDFSFQSTSLRRSQFLCLSLLKSVNYYLLLLVVETSTVEIGEQIAEGKTKIISRVKDGAGMVVIRSKDRITAGDGARAHDMVGKSVISTSTNCSVFELLNKAGV